MGIDLLAPFSRRHHEEINFRQGRYIFPPRCTKTGLFFFHCLYPTLARVDLLDKGGKKRAGFGPSTTSMMDMECVRTPGYSGVLWLMAVAEVKQGSKILGHGSAAHTHLSDNASIVIFNSKSQRNSRLYVRLLLLLLLDRLDV